MITETDKKVKRIFDLILAILLIPIIIIPLFIFVIIASVDTKEYGIFSQYRVGQYGKLFNIFKIRTLKNEPHRLGSLDKSATSFGKFLRRYKLDELPQLFNVIKGDMSFVGPRPDIEGFADVLEGEDRIILEIKPGVTGPATIKYKNEEVLLSQQVDPENYNRTIIWKDKVEINKMYIKNWSFYLDLKYIIQSITN
ncbi:glycosyl transferase [Aquaticitalea lipolytica]|uniref:Glycosyl transferase n=1 Tax=Aquaticitalea lipolytica TaxID=1247562 RepID=A0A8J2TL05_9FLAO|nr:sugar transferase [Aquaticitalea lipolytica]GFZ78173.1 glycosyl transferase [Aquaticitalea lipolytica]